MNKSADELHALAIALSANAKALRRAAQSAHERGRQLREMARATKRRGRETPHASEGCPHAPGNSVTARHPTPLLRESQRNEIFAAVEKAGLDPSAFDLTDDGAEVRVEHTMSAPCFTLYRDKTWRYLGTHFIGHGAEKPFDRSWQMVIPLISLWIAEVKGAHGALDV